MRKFLLVGLFICFFSSLAVAEQADDAVSLTGIIIDGQSASINKENLPEFVKTYTKKDALAPNASTGEYVIFLGDSYMQFDGPSSAKVADFLKKPDSSLEVTVKVNVGDEDILSLVSIENK